MSKFPDVHVKLINEDGNAFIILGKVQKALRRAGHEDAVAEFQAEATKGDYNHLIKTVMEYVEVS